MSVQQAAAPSVSASLLTLRGIVTALVVLLFAALPPLAYALSEPFYIDVFTRIMILAIGAISLNFILGYGGMVSFGHAAYIGIGAYAVGILGYYDVYSGWIQWPVGLAAAALFALLTGAICLRTKGVYFIMITLAFTQMIHFLFVSLAEYGGDDGLVVYQASDFDGLIDVGSTLPRYYLTFVIMLLSVYVVYRMIHSRFGMVIRGSRTNEPRMKALGYPTYRYRLTAYVIAGVMCGLAGLLMANFTSFVSPDMMHWTRSGDLIIIVVLGGMGTLWGPVFGALAFLMLEEVLADLTVHWQVIFGPLLILVVLFARGGIDSFLGRQGPR